MTVRITDKRLTERNKNPNAYNKPDLLVAYQQQYNDV